MNRLHLAIAFALLTAACTKESAPSTQPSPTTNGTAATGIVPPGVTLNTDHPQTAALPKSTNPTDAEGFIQHWLILDPIHIEGVGDHSEDVEKPMFAKEYFKNQLAVIPHDKDKVTVDGKPLVWHKVKVDDNQVDLAQFSADNNTDPNSCLYFGFTYVFAPDDMKVKLAIGSDDSSVWWLNGSEVIRDYASRGVTADDDTSKEVALKKGFNTLRFAVIQGDGPTGACARFLDNQDRPITAIKVSADVP